ncbi:Odorant receptor Or2 [Blattella germanica]|nr:Odorant receptor Or2 [Blattella germanica]
MIGETAYAISWYQQTTVFQRQIMMIIMRAQRPVEMSAGLFGKMSLELFSKIMNTAYSYFTLMKETIS